MIYEEKAAFYSTCALRAGGISAKDVSQITSLAARLTDAVLSTCNRFTASQACFARHFVQFGFKPYM